MPVQASAQPQTFAVPPPPQVCTPAQLLGHDPPQPSEPPHLPEHAGTQQAALGCAPTQPFAQAIVVAATHPFASAAQVATADNAQYVPEVWPLHPAGAAGQVHAALGALPTQGFPVGQAVMLLTATQPLVSFAQVTNIFDWHDVPVPAAQAAGAVGHEQFAVGCVPVHGLPAPQVMRPEMVTHPCASATQVASAVVDSQKLPCPAPHPPGAAGHAQAALGSVPRQIWTPGHFVSAAHAPQP